MTIPRAPGAYIITHLPTGVYYIGSSQNIGRRIVNHRNQLQMGTHPNKRLLETVKSLDELSIVSHPTETLDQARDKEQELLDKHHGQDLCCNVGTGSRSPWSIGGVPESLKKLNRGRALGNRHSEGHVVSDEVKDAVRRANTGLKRSEETIAKLRAAAPTCQMIPRQVSVNGIVYDSISAAAKAHGVSSPTVRNRIQSESECFSGWSFH